MRQALRNILKAFFLLAFAKFLRKSFFSLFDSLAGLVFKSPDRNTQINSGDIKKILLIRFDRIGDLILTLPAIRAIRKSFPLARIELLVNEYTAVILKDDPCVDRLLIYKKDQPGKDYDLAIAFQAGFVPNLITFKSNAVYRIGYSGWGGSFFLTHKLFDYRDKILKHETQWALDLASLAGVDLKGNDFFIEPTLNARRQAEEFLVENNVSVEDVLIGVHPGARQEYIRWYIGGFAGVSDRLISENGFKVVFFCGDNELDLVDQMISRMKEKPILARAMPLEPVIGIIKRCRVFLANSSGPMHLAAALKVPVVAIFGSRHPRDHYNVWHPLGEGHTIITKNSNCISCDPSVCSNTICMDLIDIEQVYRAVLKSVL